MRGRIQAISQDDTGHKVSLDECVYRLKWDERAKKLQEDDADIAARQHAMANVDWHDFVVVATIDFEADQTLIQVSRFNCLVKLAHRGRFFKEFSNLPGPT